MASEQKSRSRRPGKKKSGEPKKPSQSKITLSKRRKPKPHSDKDLQADLRTIIDKVESGDDSALRGAYFSPMYGMSVRQRWATCDPPNYLQSIHEDGLPVSNSFEWWDKTAPISGPITNDFECQFTPALATVVGSQVTGGHAGDQPLRPNFWGFRTIPWDVHGYQSPNQVPGIEFAIRVERPKSVPALREQTFPNANPILLINEEDERPPRSEFEIPADLRPSVWLDFVTPQRAVGIEYGYMDFQDGHEIHPSGVKLIAYDENDNILDAPDGSDLHSRGTHLHGVQIHLEGDKFNNRIGVMDQEGRIRAVELRFDYDQYDPGGQYADLERDPQWEAGNKIQEPQTIFRIWHEALPHAAVKQGVVAREYHPPDPQNPDAPSPSSGALPLTLPFGCNRALVMMRGFKLEFLDGQAREIGHFGARLAGQRYFEAERGDTITIHAAGTLYTADEGGGGFGTGTIGGPAEFGPDSPPYRASIYFTALAWDTDQVELYVNEGAKREYSSDSDLSNAMEVPDPCPLWIKRENWFHHINELCGPLFGGLQGFYFHPNETQEVDNVALRVGTYPSYNGLDRVGPSPAGEKVQWGFGSGFVGDSSDGHHRQVSGAVVTGRSLKTVPAPQVEVFDLLPKGARSSSDDFIVPWHVVRDGHQSLIWPEASRADVAFLSVKYFYFQPEGPVRELEIELQGKYHDGCTVDWQLGGGISAVTPPDDDEDWGFMGLPAFGGVVHKRSFAEPKLVIQDLAFRTLVGLTATPDPHGFIRNVGDRAAMLTEFRKGTHPDNDLFDYRFAWRGVWYSLDGLANILPIQLSPGQVLWITGFYSPTALAGLSVSDVLPNFGTLEVQTNVGVKYISASGVAGPNPGGEWQPRSLNFGSVPVGQTKTLLAALVTTGYTPLTVSQFSLRHENLGFNFSIRPGIEPEAVHLAVSYTGRTEHARGGAMTSLIADTNAGLIDLRLSATAGPAPRD